MMEDGNKIVVEGTTIMLEASAFEAEDFKKAGNDLENPSNREVEIAGEDFKEDEEQGIIVKKSTSFFKNLFVKKVKIEVPMDHCFGSEDEKAEFKQTFKSAMKGSKYAKNILGIHYDTGLGRVTVNTELAIAWYTQSASEGYYAAMNNLGLLYLSGHRGRTDADNALAFKWLSEAAEAGYVYSQYHLAVMYWKGEGIDRDVDKAFEYFKKAGKSGLSTAMNNVGVMYLFGEGVRQNIKKAIKWLRKADELGNSEAQHNLGLCYTLGIGGLKCDDRKAFEYYDMSMMPLYFLDDFCQVARIDNERHDRSVNFNELLVCLKHYIY